MERTVLMATVRRRDLPSLTGRGSRVKTLTPKDPRFPPNITKTLSEVTGFPKGLQVTASENHPGWRTRKRSTGGDIGGNFSSTKKTIRSNMSSRRIYLKTDAGTTWVENDYLGPVIARNSNSLTFPPVSTSGESAMSAWGAKAVASAKPTNALVDLSTTLGEMLGPGGIPRLTSRAAYWKQGVEDALNRASDDFLSFEFGLSPLTSDIVGFANVVSRFNVLVKQYERDAGKVVRRRWYFEPIISESFSTLAAGMGPGTFPSGTFEADMLGASTGRVVLSRKTEIRRWFSGAFTYHLPRGYSSRNVVASFESQAKHMLGLQLTPETLWNLAPWSWAVDWFSSAGDVVSNISDWSTDGLVMRYGYIMEHSVSTDTYTWDDKGTSSTSVVPAPVVLTSESKVRQKANPFGFGLTWAGLSPRQLAIAAALGITKS